MKKKKILIIEDEDVCAQLVNLVINKEKTDVLLAADGVEGLRMALSEQPDLIFLDIMMPRMDGYGVIKSLRRDPDGALIPIVVMSARAGDVGKQTILELGCQEYIPKPFKVKQIKNAIELYMKKDY